MFASKDTLLTRPSGYTIARSVRFRGSATSYFNRTWGTPTNNQIWTFSCWAKLGDQTNYRMQLLSSGITGSPTDYAQFQFIGGLNYQETISSATALGVTTSAVFRDPAAWYHVVLAVDTTQATATNRVKIYVNGILQTVTISTQVAQNTNTTINKSTRLGGIGALAYNGSYINNSDGYQTESYFIDGQALTPSSFGETDSITGVWKAKKYAGTYGTNGFYLNFSDNSNNTATTIGKDYSGNGNNWTPNNISVTAGSTYDSMTDVPTLTSATAANYPVWNPLDKGTSSGSTSNANLNCNPNTSTSVYGITTTMEIPITGKYYFELLIGSTGGSGQAVVSLTPQAINSVANGGYNNTGCFAWVLPNNEIRLSGSAVTTGVSFVANDVIGVAVNNGIIAFYKNNTLIYTYATNMSSFTGSYVAMFSGSSNASTSINFGQQPWTYTPPTGYVALNTFNLPASTITNGAAYMAATTYSGNSSTQTISNAVNGVSFQPDFVWMKVRSAAYDHTLQDSIRGTTKYLNSNNTAAEDTATTLLTSFNSSGFSLGNSGNVNASGQTYIGWQWKAGGTAASNTNGSITSTVSVGATQGFSVVTYTGNGSTGTVGHGLGVTPSMVIVKNRTSATDWAVWTPDIYFSQGTYLLYLNTTAAKTATSAWNNSNFASTYFPVGSSSLTNSSATNYVAYCFSAVAGYSAFGSYTGNGSSDGPFVYLGFRPRYVMTKRTDSTGNWYVWDSARLGYNGGENLLYPDLSIAESSYGSAGVDLLSNGFKIRNTDASENASGGTYIYACFAESPFKTSLAR